MKSQYAFALLLCGLLSPALLRAQGGAGRVDSTFGTNGTVITPLGGDTYHTSDIALQADGRIVLAGTYKNDTTGNYDLCLIRYRPNGAPDSTYATNGVLRYALSAATGEGVSSVIIQPSGKAVIAGGISNAGGNYNKWVLARFTTAGAPDSTFGTGGRTVTDFGFSADGTAKMVQQPDGRLVVAGSISNLGTQLTVARYTANGLPDSSFGTNGRFIYANGQPVTTTGSAVALQPDGKLLIAGSIGSPPNYISAYALLRLTADGRVDSAFGTNGLASVSVGYLGDVAASILVQPDGRIVLAGTSGGFPNNSYLDFMLLRFTANGQPDPTFGSNGQVRTSMSNVDDVTTNALLLADGKILVSGYVSEYPARYVRLGLARYDANGQPDAAFGTNGRLLLQLGTQVNTMGLLQQPDGKVIVSGSTYDYNTPGRINDDYFLMRFGMGAAPAGLAAQAAAPGGPLVYPNPCTGSLTIRYPSPVPAGNGRYELLDLAGRCLLRGALDGRIPARVDMSAVPPGIYLLQATLGGRTAQQQVLKQ